MASDAERASKAEKRARKAAQAAERGLQLCRGRNRFGDLCGTRIRKRWYWPWCWDHVPRWRISLSVLVVGGGIVLRILGVSADLLSIAGHLDDDAKAEESTPVRDTLQQQASLLSPALDAAMLARVYPLGYQVILSDRHSFVSIPRPDFSTAIYVRDTRLSGFEGELARIDVGKVYIPEFQLFSGQNRYLLQAPTALPLGETERVVLWLHLLDADSQSNRALFALGLRPPEMGSPHPLPGPIGMIPLSGSP